MKDYPPLPDGLPRILSASSALASWPDSVCRVLDAPELINEDCYEAWLVKLSEVSAGDDLLTEDEYNAFIEAGGE